MLHISISIFSILLCLTTLARADGEPFIDTHVHLEHTTGIARLPAALAVARAEMSRLGISLSLLLPPPQAPSNSHFYDIEELRSLLDEDTNHFMLLGGGGSLNPMLHRIAADAVDEGMRREFRQRAERVLALGAIGFGEIAVHHLSLPQMGSFHPYESIAADHPLLLLLADLAAENDVPIDIHFDAAPHDIAPLPPPLPQNRLNPTEVKANLAAFERLLEHNRAARIIWSHAGSDPIRSRTPQLCRELLARHPNLYMSVRVGRGAPHPAFALDESNRLKPIWRKLFEDFPDRFVLGSDIFHPPQPGAVRAEFMKATLDNLRTLLDQLPPNLARMLAKENARRIYRLP
ncbi:MAG: amidohydrolase family protein [Rhodocyclaceae bacterium]